MDALWLDERRKGWFGGGNDHPGLHAICVDPRDSNRLTIAISCGGVWRSEDAGKNWQLQGKGFHAPYMPPDVEEDANVQDVHAMSACAAQPDVMWAQHHAGTYRSVDGGAHWSRTAAPMPTDFGFTIVADPVNPLRAWTVPAQADTHRYAIAGAMCVCRTDDGGKHWTAFRDGLPQQFAYHLVYRHGLALAPDGRTMAMASTTGGAWLSEDAGESWTALAAQLPPVAALAWAA